MTLLALMFAALALNVALFMRSQERTMSDLQSEIDLIKADVVAVKSKVQAQADEVAKLKADLAAAPQPPSAEQLAALDAIHAELSAIVAPPAEPAPVEPPPAA